jgi:hypothetical protein
MTGMPLCLRRIEMSLGLPVRNVRAGESGSAEGRARSPSHCAALDRPAGAREIMTACFPKRAGRRARHVEAQQLAKSAVASRVRAALQAVLGFDL